MRRPRIGITCKDSSRIWSNGLTQNAYFLICLLKKAGYRVDALSQFKEIGEKIEEFEIKKLSIETAKYYDILIEVCYSITDDIIDYALKNKIKLVTINYGNVLMLMQEDLILKPTQVPAVNRGGFDVWISPHFEFSKGFVETTSKGIVSICPYIWDSKIFDKYCLINKLDASYHNSTNLNKIGIFESNINIIKTCIYPLISLEKLERLDNSIIKEVLVFNGLQIKDNSKFKEVTDSFDIKLNKKLSVEGRFPLPNILSKGYIGTILSHQFYCDLNYLVLEGLHTNFPTIHNSAACSDAGYFYSGFDTDQCIEQIKYAISEHDSNIEFYKKRSLETLNRFSINNEINIKDYKYLINNLN